MVQTEAIPTTYEKRFALKGQCKSFVLLGRGQGTRVCAAQQHPIVGGAVTIQSFSFSLLRREPRVCCWQRSEEKGVTPK